MSLFIDFHVLQTVPPSCVNRDDTGSPKTAIYGGAVRARVSSQAWKHAMRDEFKKLFEEQDLGVRTKYMTEKITRKVLNLAPDMDFDTVNEDIRKVLETKINNKKWFEFDDKKQTKALFFIGAKQIEAFANLYISGEKDLKKYKSALKSDGLCSVDIALFGRMAASDPTLNYDAASQVAHAISTHSVQNEYDYFTAVDDLQTEDNAGAGHLGTVEFNSSTLYRYATVNATELCDTLVKENVAETVKKFGQAFIRSMPTGKINTFANRTFPDTVYITLRSDQPENLCGAFEKPVKRSENGYVEASKKALADYASDIYTRFTARPDVELSIDSCFGESVEVYPLTELLTELEKAVSAKLDEV